MQTKTLLLSMFALAISPACFAQPEDALTTFNGIVFSAPIGYETEVVSHQGTEEAAIKYTQSPSEAEITALLSAGDIDVDDVDLIRENPKLMTVRNLQLIVMDIPVDALPDSDTPKAAAENVHDRFSSGFTGRWGPSSFCYFHDDVQMTSCINTIGAFIAVHTRLVDNKLVNIEAIDWVIFRQAGDAIYPDDFDKLSRADRFEIVKDAAMWDEAYTILNSVTVEN